MVSLSGAPDYQSQQAQSVTNLGPFAVAGGVTQFFDLSAVIQPYHQALWIRWDASGAYAGNPVLLTVSDTAGIQFVQPLTLLADGRDTYVDMNAQWAGALPLGGPMITLTKPAALPGVMIGTLQVVAFTDLIRQYPVSHIESPFATVGTSGVVVGAGLTVLIKPTAAVGTYHRIKHLSWSIAAAPAAAATMAWTFTGGTMGAIQDIAGPAVAQRGGGPCDIRTDQDFSLTNASTAQARAGCVWEVYPI